MDNVVLEEDKSKKEFLLGCHIQADLKWHSQISSLMSKLETRLLGLTRIKHVCPYGVRKIITEGIFNSVLVYCLPLYGGLGDGELKNLQVLQNKAAQVATLSPPRAERKIMFDTLGWLSVNQLIFYHTVISIFKMRSFNEPENLASVFNLESRNSRIIIPNCGLRLTQKSFTIRGASCWNKLPAEITRTHKIGQFKKQIRKWLVQNVPRFLD